MQLLKDEHYTVREYTLFEGAYTAVKVAEGYLESSRLKGFRLDVASLFQGKTA